MMAFARRMQSIHRFGGDDQGRVKAERYLCGIQVVVNRLRDSDDVDAFAIEIARDVLRTVPANHDHGVNSEPSRVVHAQRRIIGNHLLAIFHGLIREGISTIRGAKNRAAPR